MSSAEDVEKAELEEAEVTESEVTEAEPSVHADDVKLSPKEKDEKEEAEVGDVEKTSAETGGRRTWKQAGYHFTQTTSHHGFRKITEPTPCLCHR